MDNYNPDQIYRSKQSKITKLNWQNGVYDFLKKDVIRKCAKNGCKNKFETKSYNPKKYCSRRCATIVNNTGHFKLKEKRFCVGCGIELTSPNKIKFCSNRCQCNLEYRENIKLWKEGKHSGVVGISTRTVSPWIRKYLFEKYFHKCARCGWNEKNPVTGNFPLEIEHIDGNSENNTEENLILLCPNCHALTPFYKNLNRGKGRKWRMNKYIKNPTT